MPRNFLLPTILSVIIAPSTEAVPILLAEYTQFHRNGTFQFSSTLPPGVPFEFKAGLRYWTQTLTAADVGHTFEAPTEFVDSLQEAWTLGYTFGGYAGTGAQMFTGSLDYWLHKPLNEPPPDTFTSYVSDLSDYRLTGFTRRVDSLTLEWIQQGQVYVGGGGQSFRFFGLQIPEPKTAILWFVAWPLVSLFRLPHTPPTAALRVGTISS